MKEHWTPQERRAWVHFGEGAAEYRMAMNEQEQRKPDSIPVKSIPFDTEEVVAFIAQYLARFVPGFSEAFESFVKNRRDEMIRQLEQQGGPNSDLKESNR